MSLNNKNVLLHNHSKITRNFTLHTHTHTLNLTLNLIYSSYSNFSDYPNNVLSYFFFLIQDKSKMMHNIFYHVSLVSFTLEWFLSLSWPFVTLPLCKSFCFVKSPSIRFMLLDDWIQETVFWQEHCVSDVHFSVSPTRRRKMSVFPLVVMLTLITCLRATRFII